jgi:integrase
MKVRLTTERVERAQPPQDGRSLYLWDKDLRGFGVRVRRRAAGPPSRTYVIRYGTGRRGKGKTPPIGQHGQPWKPDPETGEPRILTLRMAREEAIWRLGQRALGKDPAAAVDARGVLTLRAFASIYLAGWSDVEKAPAAASKDRTNLELHILPAFGDLRLDLVDAGDVAALKKAMRDKPVTFNRCLSLLHHLFRVARRWRKKSGLPAGHPNPCEDVTRYEELERERPLTLEELASVGRALTTLVARFAVRKRNRAKEDKDAVSPIAAAAIRTLMATGARPSEILGIRRAELEAAIAAGAIVRPSRKVGRRRRRRRPVYLNPIANALLRGAPVKQGNPYVFPGRIKETHLTIYALDAAWERVRAAAGVEDVRLYDVSRHAFGTMAALLASNPQAVQDLLGHADFRTTLRYIHRPAAPLLELSEKTAAAIDDALEGRKGGNGGDPPDGSGVL